MKKQIPALRIAVTPSCNMNCQYCPGNGESGLLKNRLLTKAEFKEIISIAYECGVRSFSITGGEPLLVPELTFSITELIHSFPKISYIKLNTNGILIPQYINEIRHAHYNQIKVSLDSFKTETHKKLSSCPFGYKDTLEGIDLLIQNTIPARLQIVVGKYNFEELKNLIDFCIKKKIDVCLFDILYFSNNKSGSRDFWQENYISLKDIKSNLANKFPNIKEIQSVGNFGHKIIEIDTLLGTKIQIRDTSEGSHYSSVCKDCQYYKCEEGLCTLVLSADGRLKVCRNEGFDISLLSEKGNLKSGTEIKNSFLKIFQIFQNSEFNRS